MQKDNRRNKIVIDKERQFKLMLTTVIYMLVTLLVVATAVFFPSMIDLSGEISGVNDYQLDSRISAGGEFAILHQRFWPAVLVVVILLGLHSLVILHRVFGPLYRMRVFFDQVGSGDLSGRLTFRKDDYLLREQDTVNKMMESLNEKLHRVKSGYSSLEESLGALLGSNGDEEVEAADFDAKVKDIGEKEAELKAALDAIKIAQAKSE